MRTFLFGLVACTYTFPNPKPPDANESRTDSDSTESDAPTDSDTGSTSTAPTRCDLLETEPNNSVEDIQTLPTEIWACGDFLAPADADFFEFVTPDDGWMEVTVAAADRGSAADVQVNLYDASTSVYMSDGYLTSDPNIVFPVSAGDVFGAIFAEHTLLYGETYFWYSRVSQVKPPVEWTRGEVENNDAIEVAEPFIDGDVVMASMGAAGDFDWYAYTPPDLATAVTYQIKSASYGAPTDLTLLRYDAEGDQVGVTYSGSIPYDPDPYYVERYTEADPAEPRFIQIKDASGRGSRFAWYLLEITASYD